MRSTKQSFICATLGVLCLVAVTASCEGVPYEELGEDSVGLDEGDQVNAEAKKLVFSKPFIVECPVGISTVQTLTDESLATSGWTAPPRLYMFNGASLQYDVSTTKSHIACWYKDPALAPVVTVEQSIEKQVDAVCTQIAARQFKCTPNL